MNTEQILNFYIFRFALLIILVLCPDPISLFIILNSINDL